MLMYNSIEYSDNYSKTSGSLWQYYRDESVFTYAGAIKNFHVGDNNSTLVNFKQKITDKTDANGRKNVKIAVPLKYLSNFGEMPLEMILIHCEINLILNCSEKCVLSNDTKATTFAITDAKILCSSCNFSNSRSWKDIATIKIRF